MDEPVIYKGVKQAGLFFIESDSYLPLRGNGWYSLPMVDYCLDRGIITENNIKFAVYAQLTIPHNYYNAFIDFLYNNLGEHAKLSVNGMIGSFKLKERENWTSLLITQNANEAFNHYIHKNGCFIDHRQINDKNYYQVYNKYKTEKEDTEAPIYNQVLDLEAIELHRLKTIIEENNGLVLDVSTDCAICIFKDNKLPFETTTCDKKYIKGYYHDDAKLEPRYRVEDSEERLKIETLSKYSRTDRYDYKEQHFNVSSDVDDNDFKPLVDNILTSQKSWHLDGRGGTGKTNLIKMLQTELKLRGIKYSSVAPTNKACRLIDGKTIHMFVASNNGKTIRDMDIKYLFIDEVSMMSEQFYKYFIVLKRMRPDIKFILSGDFDQLQPVKERLENPDYKDTLALFEICDGQRLQLSKCRRSDATLFNMLLPHNINKLTRADFGNKFTKHHISFTNATRIKVNKMMMGQAIKDNKNRKTPLTFKKLDYDPNSQDVELLSGTPIIARKNSKELNIANNETFTIKEIRHSKQILLIEEDGRTMEIKFSDFQRMFYVAYCITVYKSQGCTFDHPYTIHEWNRYDERMKYVSLSRSTKIENINIFN